MKGPQDSYYHILRKIYDERTENNLETYNFIIPEYGIISSMIESKPGFLEDYDEVGEIYLESLNQGITRFLKGCNIGFIKLRDAALNYIKTLLGNRLIKSYELMVSEGHNILKHIIKIFFKRSTIIYYLYTNEPYFKYILGELEYPVIENPFQDFKPDLVFFKENISENSLVIFSIPNIPLGYIDLNDLDEILRILDDSGSYLLLDISYINLVFNYSSKISYRREAVDKMIVELISMLYNHRKRVIITYSINHSFFLDTPRIFITLIPRAIWREKDFTSVINLNRLNVNISYELLYRLSVYSSKIINFITKVYVRRYNDLYDRFKEYIHVPSKYFGGPYAYLNIKNSREIFNKCIDRGLLVGYAPDYIPVDHGLIVSLLSLKYTVNDSIWREAVDLLEKCIKEN
ncbi:hypothetical protein DRN87_00510 [Candidatus Geothermarchaeota archaeon]|nr:MAG: hypothetical protein DRN87_00510 [Candidatus Geothermarchaeota archaeon]